MFRFSRSKLLGRTTFAEFKRIVDTMLTIVTESRPNATAIVLVRRADESEQKLRHIDYYDEDYDYLKESESTDSEGRHSYTLEDFTEAVWSRAITTEAYIKDPASETPFMISVAGAPDSGQVHFYGQQTGPRMAEQVARKFASGLFVRRGR